MRYLRCEECGSMEVPALATCPSCGIKTPIEAVGRRWPLLLALASDLVVAVLAVWLILGATRRADRLEAEVAQLRRDPRRGQGRSDDALRRDYEQALKENALLRSKVAELTTRLPERTPSPSSLPPAADDRGLRLAQVRWSAAYTALARVWQPPYGPFEFLATAERQAATLVERTRALAAAVAAAPDEAAPLTAEGVAQFERRFEPLRQALGGGRALRLTVSAQADWRESDVEVKSGDIVYLRVQGAWSMASAEPAQETAAADVTPILGSAPVGALLWRVGGGGQTHAVLPGAAPAALPVDADGRLVFRINEQRLDDNSGAMQVDALVVPRSLVAPVEAFAGQVIPE